MIRIVEPRLVVEKPSTHMKYYPRVISASTQQSYPFSVSAATIDVVSNLPPNTSKYVAPLSFDDIIRLQVSVKYHPTDRTVWQDIFHGRIENISSTFGTSNQLSLYCVGHEGELRTDLIEETIDADATKPYTEPVDAKTLLAYFSKYFSRITYSASDADQGVSFPTYDVTKDQNFLIDLIGDMEKTAGYDWAFKVIPTYDSSNNFSGCHTEWKQFTETPATSYKIIEGTQRLISADFEAAGEDVRTFQRVYGGQNTSVTPNVQYLGAATSSTLEALYGKRSAVDTYNWILSDSLCSSVASGMLSGLKSPTLSGQVTLIGTPEAKIGDYVHVRIPSLEINGDYVWGIYYVKRVQHSIDKSKFQTTLDLGRIKPVAEDYIAIVAKVTKLCKRSLVCQKKKA